MIHFTQDKRENADGRGCMHQGGSGNEYREDKNGCYTTARKVCSNSLAELIAWAKSKGYVTQNCKHCDSKRFPFPLVDDGLDASAHGEPDMELFVLPGELDESRELREGAVRRIPVNAYERNPTARRLCIERYGSSCAVCGFNFGDVYGELARGFIHVHHLRPLSEVGEEYQVDTIEDLRPVCPNCHAVLHLGAEGRTIDDIKGLLRANRKE